MVGFVGREGNALVELEAHDRFGARSFSEQARRMREVVSFQLTGLP